MSSDLELLKGWRAGDRAAGNELFKRHYKPIYNFFRNKVDDGIEDLVQRTFLACLEAAERFREEASLRTFLFGIAHNLLRDRFRRSRRAGEAVDIETQSVVDLGASPTSVMAARDEENLLVQALRRIPVAAQVILELYFWEDMTGAEIGAILGVPENTARSRLRRAKEQLAEVMEKLQASPELLASTLSNIEAWAGGLRDQLGAAARR
ncbi:sigma-70 family RNA polymerase sigma factor [Nannocystis sp. ILAH1]|uniref:RNA polymerase sigma factor n=1 Tax=unclassified Nannocystis TaxID=2627009 RepID=UPI0022716FE0|nr:MULTISPECIES: sigma-70 family RNA polymerase sigma factor [unclassified Nannocystis]MCY0986498.1 sigma-70 family RNA polymerase sigma factor [Nannocystis sp. ILAH1]MCY1071373.1 sigma-70 family RNA polymerase sigma factor [Nannocystis sp. RBIL2]